MPLATIADATQRDATRFFGTARHGEVVANMQTGLAEDRKIYGWQENPGQGKLIDKKGRFPIASSDITNLGSSKGFHLSCCRAVGWWSNYTAIHCLYCFEFSERAHVHYSNDI